MNKGIVMETGNDFLIVLTPEGQFLEVKKHKDCAIGEEITFTPLKQRSFFHHFSGIKQLAAAAALLLILLGCLFPMYQNDKAYAYMSIDVNPSIEIGINKKLQVVKITPFNKDGENIIKKIGPWEKVDINIITKSILSELKKQGYLQKNRSVIISTVYEEKPDTNIEKQLSKYVEEIKEMIKENGLKPVVVKGTEQDMKKAHSLGITTGKYKEEKMNSIHPMEKTAEAVTARNISNPKGKGIKSPMPGEKPINQFTTADRVNNGQSGNSNQKEFKSPKIMNNQQNNNRLSDKKSLIGKENKTEQKEENKYKKQINEDTKGKEHKQ